MQSIDILTIYFVESANCTLRKCGLQGEPWPVGGAGEVSEEGGGEAAQEAGGGGGEGELQHAARGQEDEQERAGQNQRQPLHREGREEAEQHRGDQNHDRVLAGGQKPHPEGGGYINI